MTAPQSDSFLDRIGAQAREAERVENEFRAGYRDQLTRLERERAIANRRHALAKLLAGAIDGADNGEQAVAAGARILSEEFGLSADNPAHKVVIDAFAAVSDAIDTVLNCEGEPDHAEVMQALETFEIWYQARTGQTFYALYDVYVPQTPVVDF